jgi:leucyl aminopeptidase (aminopeptidase T)
MGEKNEEVVAMTDKQALAAATVVEVCMGAKAGETVLVVSDEGTEPIGRAFVAAARKAGLEAVLMLMQAREISGAEPPAAVAQAMSAVDICLLATTKSLSHTSARREACARGARIASLPGITEEMMNRTLTGDYAEIAAVSKKVAEIMDKAATARVVSPLGTDITMSLVGRKAKPDTGILTQRGDFGNLPAGEAYIAPVEGTAQGIIVVDGSMLGGLMAEPLKLVVEDGYVVFVAGGADAEKLRGILEKYGREAGNIAELGVGTNPLAVLTGNVLEDEKVAGTVHLAIGNNMGFGGKVDVPVHLDGVLKNPTLYLDAQVVVKDGKLV